MTNRSGRVAIVILVLAGVMPGCGSSRGGQAGSSAFAPTPATTGTSPIHLYGYVGDTGLRQIAGASVEVLKGPQAGMVLTSDADGHFSSTGVFNGVTMRATKDGYAPDTEPVSLTSTGAYVIFDLVSLVPPVQMASNYTLTITADSSCTSLPEEVRTRSYSATLTPTPNGNAPANTLLSGFVTGGQFAPYGNTFWIGVSGDYLGISTNGEVPSLVEDLGANRYLAYAIDAAAAGVMSGAPTISASFTGTIEYCELSSGLGAYYDCSTFIRREQCNGTNGRLTLTSQSSATVAKAGMPRRSSVR